MNKKLIPFAVAAALTAPFAAQAEVTIYGKANVSYDAVKVDKDEFKDLRLIDAAGNVVPFGDVFFIPSTDRHYKVVSNEPLEGASRASRLGFKGSEDLGNGLKAIWKMEFSVDLANNSPVNSNRNAYVGLAGDAWGTALIGRHDTPYKMSQSRLDYFSDQLGDFNGTVGFEDLRAQNTVAYISPNWAGFNVSGAIVSPGGDDLDGTSIGEDWQEGYSIAGTYSNSGFFIGAAWEKYDKQVAFETGVAKKKWTVGGGWEGDAFGISGRYEDRKDQFDLSKADTKSWQVQGKFNFGNNTAKAFWGNTDPDDFARGFTPVTDPDGNEFIAFQRGKSYSSWGLGWDYNFTRRSQLYAQWINVDRNWDGFSLGMSHKF